jgi:hypothetical protein
MHIHTHIHISRLFWSQLKAILILQVTSPTRPDKVFSYFSISLGFAEARAVCVSNGGDLATLTSDEETSAILNSGAKPQLWIGLNDIVAEGSFYWADGSNSTYRQWGGSEPNNMNNEDCAVMLNTGAWNDAQCWNAFAYLCATCGQGSCTQVCMYVCMYLCM